VRVIAAVAEGARLIARGDLRREKGREREREIERGVRLMAGRVIAAELGG
jgi:hypothetical protein